MLSAARWHKHVELLTAAFEWDHLKRFYLGNLSSPCCLQDMLVFLYLEGPYTRGVFRRSAGAKACRELRDRLDSGTEDPEITHQSVFVIAAVLKVKHTHTDSTTHSSAPSHLFETRQQKAGATDVRPKSHKSRQDNLSLHSQAGCQSHTQGAALFSIQAKQPPQHRASREQLRWF